jgi:hypothetical protein
MSSGSDVTWNTGRIVVKTDDKVYQRIEKNTNLCPSLFHTKRVVMKLRMKYTTENESGIPRRSVKTSEISLDTPV